MNERLTAGAATLMTSLAGLAQITRVWPAPTGRHRRVPGAQRVPGAVVGQRFVNCPECEVETAATVHGSTVRCTEGHLVVPGGVE